MPNLSTFDEEKKIHSILDSFCRIFFANHETHPEKLKPFCSQHIILYYSLNQRPYLGFNTISKYKRRVLHNFPLEQIKAVSVLNFGKDPKGWHSSVEVSFSNNRSFFCYFEIVEEMITNSYDETLDTIDENGKIPENKQLGTKLCFTYLRVVEDAVKNSLPERDFLAREDNKITSFSDIKSIFLLEGGISGYAELEIAENLPIISVDARLCKFLGYDSIEELLAVKNAINLIHPTDAFKKKDFLLKQFEYGNEFSIDFRVIDKTNNYIWVSAVGRVKTEPTGKKHVKLNLISINEKISEAEKFFQFVQKNSNGFAIYGLNKESETFAILYSPTLYDILKLTPPNEQNPKGGLTFKNQLSTILEKSEADYYYSILSNSIQSGNPFSYDLEIIVEDSKIKWINASGQIYKNKNGNAFLYVMYTDVSSYKAHTEKLQKLYENANGSILTCILNHERLEILEAGNSFYKNFGYSDLEISQIFENDFLKIIDTNSREELTAYLENYCIDDTELSLGVEIIAKNGEKLIYLLLGNTRKFHETIILDVLLIDVTESHRAKSLLEQANKEINQLYHNIPGAVMRCSKENTYNVDFANDGFYHLSGYSQNEFHETFDDNLRNIIHPEDRERVVEKLYNLECPQKISLQFRAVRKDSSIIWVDMHAKAIYDEFGKSYLYCTCTNITDRYDILDTLKITKEKMRIAILNSGLTYWDYYPIEQIAVVPNIVEVNAEEQTITNFPNSMIDSGKINEKSINDFIELHQRVKNGEFYAEADILGIFNIHGEEEWRKVRYTNVLNTQGRDLCYVGTSESIEDYKEIERKFHMTTAQVGIHVWVYNIGNKTIIQEPKHNFFDSTATNIIENVPESLIESGLIHPEDIEKCRKAHIDMNNGVEQNHNDYRIFNKAQNKYTWIRTFYSLIKDKLGKPYIALGSAMDISEQKRAEESYREYVQLWTTSSPESILSGIANLSLDQMLYVKLAEDFDLTPLPLSKKFESFAERILDEEVKQKFLEDTNSKKLIENLENGINSYSLETKLLLSKHNSIWASLSLSTIKHPTTSEIMCFLSVKDITQSKLSEIMTQKFMDSQFDFMMYINYELDTYRVFPTKHIQNSMNKIQICSGKYSEDIQIFLVQTVLDEDRDKLAEESKIATMLERIKNEGDYEIYFRTFFEGETKYKQIKIFMLDEKAKNFCLGCVDVTAIFLQEKEKTENLRQTLSIATKANEFKSSFLASMSHDIRTPMNAIIGMTNLAIEDINNKAQVEESLSVIKSSSEHLLDLLNDILEMSRLESGKATFSNDTFSIYQECSQVYNFFKGITKQKRQTLNFFCTKLSYEYVISDLTRFNRVLTNLLGNAVKFTPEDGKITLKLEEISLEQNGKIANFRITVEDSGIGISKEGLEHIFDAFHREEKSVSKIEGTGLGLAIVKALVDYQDGEIRVESELGKGSRFIVDLPMIVVKKESNDDLEHTKKINMSDVNINGRNVLLVEDHPVNILVATKILEKMGAKITVAKNGQEGVDTFINSSPKFFDLIFMDLQMPIMGGLEASKMIRESNHAEAKNIPIVAMTANAYAEDVRKSKQAGMNYHIAKPITVENIHTCLATLNLLN